MVDKKTIHEMVTQAGGDATQSDAVIRYIEDTLKSNRKDAMPAAGRGNGPILYENGPFTHLEGDVFSSVVTGGSPLLQWIPTRMINDRYKPVNHLDWVAPEGFDGSQPYADWLAANGQIDECGYGPTTTWSGFAWQAAGGSFSWRTRMMKPYEDGGTRYYEDLPTHTVRGQAGIPLSSDREWAIARLFIVLQQHLDYVIKHGDATNSNMEWDGLDQILRPGYVQSRLIGSGNPTWANPDVTNGATITTAAAALAAVRGHVRRILNRANARQWEIGLKDMAVVMPAAMWDNLAEHVASGAMWRFTNTYNFTGDMTPRDFQDMYQRTRTGGVGFGTLSIDGRDVPVIVDHSLGYQTTLSNAPAITSDIYILTRRANGLNLLEQQYVDWRNLDYPTNGLENIVDLAQGHVRAGWVVEANKCFYYYAEMAGRLMSYMQPMQAVIRNVTIPTLVEGEVQGANFYSPDFYAFGGQMGGTGTPRL